MSFTGVLPKNCGPSNCLSTKLPMAVSGVSSFRRRRIFLSSTGTDSSLLVGESQGASGGGAMLLSDGAHVSADACAGADLIASN